MPKKSASNKPTLGELFAKIPDFPLGQVPVGLDGNPLRLALAKRALMAGYESAEDDPADALCDLLADLRHLCDALGLDYAAADRTAYQYYLEEKSEESGS